MSINFSKNPGFLLTRFHRTEEAPKADEAEKFGKNIKGEDE